MSENNTISFTVDEVNKILNYLAEVPAKYSMDLINFIAEKSRAQGAATAPVEQENAESIQPHLEAKEE